MTLRRLGVGLVGIVITLSASAAWAVEPRYKAIPSLGWSLDRVVDLTSAGSVSATDVAITGLNCAAFGNGGALTTDSVGNLLCSTDDTGAGGGHAILSATHTDSVANAVSRGSLIYGNATPAWDELGIGAADTVLASDGTDAAWDASVDVASLTASGTVTGQVVSATAALQVGSDYIRDITGTGLSVTAGGALTATGGSGAPTDADYLVGTANGSLSAEIAVGTTPGGELGNTWASPTLDDSVTTTGWVMGTFSGTTLTAGTVNIDLLDAVGAVDMDYGSADVTDHTFTTDGTGDAEFVVPNESLGAAEIVNKATNHTFTPKEAKLSGAYVLSTFASLDTAAESATIDGGSGPWKLLFDATTDEAAVWDWVLPDDWAAHGTLVVIYALASATTLEVEWEAAIQCVTPGDAADIDTASFADGATAGGNTVPGTAGHTDSSAVTLTDDSCAAGDSIYFYVSTDADDATNDDATGDRELLAVEYNYTTTQ